jgi:hypothetical protein
VIEAGEEEGLHVFRLVGARDSEGWKYLFHLIPYFRCLLKYDPYANPTV